ncbi:MAG: 5'-deoxynucleotidase [Candidatus Latescibacteria bacterium]|nr:5'-deoxynucleotidase [Candidatus Latescibacterota bacterium]
MSASSHFFAYLSRMKLIQRWGLMRNTCPENIQEHSLQVALVAHCLALIRNRMLGGQVDPQRVMALALFHEVGEVITGDLASPIKYFNPEIKAAYGRIEEVANHRLLGMVPAPLREEYRALLFPEAADGECLQLVKAADKLCAYLKCLEELKAGNQEFSQARAAIERELGRLEVPEVAYFVEQFVPSFSLTLDELN